MFPGFSEPTENWSKLPHEFIEVLPQVETVGEMKVILYVLRHTWGFQEFEGWDAKRITTDEFANGRKRRDGTRLDSGTGLTKPTIYNGLKRAVEHGFLICYVDNTDKGRISHYYHLRRDAGEPGTVYACNPSTPGTSPWNDIPQDTRTLVYQKFQGRCAYCERKSRKWHYDHIVPKSRGGTDDVGNLALACPSCNMAKHTKTPDEWRRPVIYYEDDVKKVYRGWSVFLIGPSKKILPDPVKSFDQVSKKVLPRTEKDTCEKDTIRKIPDKKDIAQASPKSSPKSRVSAGSRKKLSVPPAVTVFRSETQRYPAKSWYADLEKIEDLDRWRSVVHAYIGLGWNPTNVKSMLEWYDRNEIPNVKGVKHESVSRVQHEAATPETVAAFRDHFAAKRRAAELEVVRAGAGQEG